MYGVIAFNKGEKASSAEFRAELGRYGRGAACKQCRISRVRCSGTLDGENCNRSKRLAKRCLYTDKRNHRSSQTVGSNGKSVASTKGASPEQSSSDNQLPVALDSSLDLASSDEAQFVADDALRLDFEGWLPSNSISSVTESLRPDIDLMASPSGTGTLDPLCFPPLELEGSQKSGEVCKHSARRLGLTDAGIDENGVAVPDLQDSITDTRGFACQCKCLQALTSSLSFLRGWTWGGGSGVDSGVRANGVALNCVKVEDFLALFEKAMAQLQIAENCPLACILSQDLAILLLVVVEQLAKLLLSLSADSTGEFSGSPLYIPGTLVPCPPGVQEVESNYAQQR
ncbi:hypothetical protein F4779DRAFT_611715, partial [Xylariaceae sp. FL0662B]